MRVTRHACFVLMLLVAGNATALVGTSAPAAPGRASPVAAAFADGISLDEAVARAEKQYNARVVRAEEKERNGRRVYRIRLLGVDGRVFEVEVDAASGKAE